MSAGNSRASKGPSAETPANLEALIGDEMRLQGKQGTPITWEQARDIVERRMWTWWGIEDKKRADPEGPA